MLALLKLIALIVSIGCLPFIPSLAQPSKEDSLLQVLKAEEDLQEKAKIYLQLSQLIMSEDAKQSFHYTEEAIRLATHDEVLGMIWDQKGRLYFAENQLDSALYSFQKAKAYQESAENPSDAARINNRVGAVLLKQNQHQQALETFLESVAFFEKTDDRVNLAICYNNMAGVFSDMADYTKAVEYNKQALQIFQEKNLQQYEIITLPSLAGQYLKLNDTLKAIEYNLKAEQLGLELKHQYALGITYNNLGQLYFEKNDPEKAVAYYKKSLLAKQNLGAGANLVPTYNNLGQSYIALHQPHKAIAFLKKGLDLARGEELLPLFSNLTKAYIATGEKDNALLFFERTQAYSDSVFSIEKQQVMDELLARYETEKKEKQIIALAAQQRKGQYLLYGVSGLLVATLFIAFLVVKNNRKKRVIAQQNEELEKQRVERLLKEQELIGIDAMLKGQEKERKKIAEELHDSLGSSLSTLKLYLNSLDTEKPPDEFHRLHTRAEELLNETYAQVRKIAHDKGAGVLINKGLIPAVRATAHKISSTKKVNIEVIDVGLTERLENSVEISLFRSIQELLSNAVKYSQASDVIVQIVQYEDKLNIIVEDNGCGFEPQKIRYGLGFTHIRDRLEKLKGEMTIDASPGNGSTVIINVPML